MYLSVDNLNTFSPDEFIERKTRKSGARFRRSLYKGQNMTIDLLNYRPGRNDTVGEKWFVGVFYGTGNNHRYDFLNKSAYKQLSEVLQSKCNLFDEFSRELDNLIGGQLTARTLQNAYENDSELADSNNPLVIAKCIQLLCDKYVGAQSGQCVTFEGMRKPVFTLQQLSYMFSLTFIVQNLAQDKQVSQEGRYRLPVNESVKQLALNQA